MEIKRKDEIINNNTQLEGAYQNGVQLRENQGDFRVYRVNEDYFSTKPRKLDFMISREI